MPSLVIATIIGFEPIKFSGKQVIFSKHQKHCFLSKSFQQGLSKVKSKVGTEIKMHLEDLKNYLEKNLRLVTP